MKYGAALVLLLLVPQVHAAIWGAVDQGAARKESVFFLRTGERLTLSWKNNHGEIPIQWFEISPELRVYDNKPGTRTQLAPIHYRRGVALNSFPQSRLVVAFGTPGTRYYCAGAMVPHRFAETEPIHRRHAAHIVQVVVRAGDRYEDFLGELLRTPFIMGPAVSGSGWHQTDQRVGSDCAAFATYGRRRLGYAIPYAGPHGIVAFLRPLVHGRLVASNDGIYRGARRRMVPIGPNGIQRGDLVHFGPQVSVWLVDRGRRGILDADDLVFQSWRATPHVTTLRDSGFFRFPISLYRWR
jgi:hypothetical protein